MSSTVKTKNPSPSVSSNSRLKAFASRLLEANETMESGDVNSPADSFKKEVPMAVTNSTDKSAEKAGDHAKKVSEPTVTLKTESSELDEEMVELKKLEEELMALVNETAGESLSTVSGEQDLAGAAESIPDEKVKEVDTTKSTAASPSNSASYVLSVKETLEHSKDTGSEEEVEDSSSAHPVKKESKVAVSLKDLKEATRKLKAKNLKRQISSLQEQLKECGMEMEQEHLMGAEPTEEADDSTGKTVVNFNFDLGDLVPELGGLGDDDEIEIVDDGGEADSHEPSMGGGGLGHLLGSHTEDEDDDSSSGDEDMSDSDSSDDEEAPAEDEELEMPAPSMTEKKKASLKNKNLKSENLSVAKKLVSENKKLKEQLDEQKLFNSKVVYLQPFMANKNLTKEQKQKIVAYLDRGQTIQEVRSIFGQVKALVEKASAYKQQKGSASQVSSASGATLTEGKAQVVETSEEDNLPYMFENATLEQATKDRFALLAGIKKSKS